MAKKKKADAPAPEAPAATAEAPATASVGKTQAVKAAIAAGHDKPKGGVAYIKTTYGLDMTTKHFSVIKNDLKKKGGITGKKRGRKAAGTVAPASAPVARANGLPPTAQSIVKALVSAYGADAVAMALVQA